MLRSRSADPDRAPARAWRDIATPLDRAVYEAAGYGQRDTPGARPALIVIDVTYGFVGRARAPILESIKTYPNSCGEAGWDAVRPIRDVLAAARRAGAPVFFTGGLTGQFESHVGRWREKHPRTLAQPDDAHEIVAELRPVEGEIVVRKTKPSAFHGTPLLDLLIDARADTLVVTGCTTSGCVRATVVDAFSYGFHTIVVEDGVFDRGEIAHAANLFDMDQKYANVMPSALVVEYLDRCAAGSMTEAR
ncbi:MAG TPA: isochorismatase family protein [Candidatus Limnocylindria bacterium]|nr:isochorismatase family protein [Candidatus Limnocylindria bacterium]